jgi:iron complex outermembrane receptor protein
VSNNFRAPSLTQIGFQSTTSNFGDGGVLVDVRTLSVNDPIARALGARDLKPETSENFSLGVTGQLSDRLDVSLDVFQINIDDRVTLSQRLGSDALEDFVEDNFGVSGVHDVVFFSNAANTRTRGAELVSNYRQPLFAGKLLVTTSYTYNKTKVRSTQAIPGQLTDLDITETDLVGVEERNTLTDATPRDRFIVNATWNSPRWGLLGRVTRHGKTTRVFNFGGGYEPTQTYDARWQLDAEVSYRVTQNLSFAVGGNNLTDNYPERSSDEINYGGNLPYDVLSPIGSNGAYYYGRAAFTF